MRTFVCIFAGLISFSALAGPEAAPAESCSVLAGSPPQKIAVPDLGVTSLTGAVTFKLPESLPPNVGAVVCQRQSIVPAEFDYKVLQAGYPFAISVQGHGTLWLEINEGKIAISFDEGALSEAEMIQTQEWINKVQPYFYKDAVPGEK